MPLGIVMPNLAIDSLIYVSAVSFLDSKYELNLFFMYARLKTPSVGITTTKMMTTLPKKYLFSLANYRKSYVALEDSHPESP